MTWTIRLNKQNQKFETTKIILLDHIVYLNAKANMLILHVICLQLDIANNSAQKVWQKLEFVFGKDLLNHQLFQYISLSYKCVLKGYKYMYVPSWVYEILASNLDSHITHGCL